MDYDFISIFIIIIIVLFFGALLLYSLIVKLKSFKKKKDYYKNEIRTCTDEELIYWQNKLKIYILAGYRFTIKIEANAIKFKLH